MTSKDELLGLLRQEQADKESEDAVDWEAKRDEWIEALRSLRDQIQGWLEDAEFEKLLQVSEHDYDVQEERLGAYSAPGLVIKTPQGHTVEVKPVARVIIGGQGRVDLVAGPNKAMLIKDERDAWGFGVRHHRGTKVTELNEESFAEALSELLR